MNYTFERISADEAKTRRKDHLRSSAGGDAIAKAMKAPPSWDKDGRSARFVMTTQQVDRYGDIVVTDGINTTEFERNPVGLLFHDSRSWPVAHWSGLEKILKGRPPRMEGDFVLAPAGGPGDIGERVAEAEFAISNGIVRACSIGFMPDWDEVESIRDEEGNWLGIRFNASELLECSVCAIPANPGALAKEIGNPKLAMELIEDILDNYARSPAGLIIPRSELEAAHREAAGNPTTMVVTAVAEPETSTPPRAEFDDVDGCELDFVNLLARREVLYCTTFTRDEKTYGGFIVAATWAAAEEIATDRGFGETVDGQVVMVLSAEGRVVPDKILPREITTEYLANMNAIEVASEVVGDALGQTLKAEIADILKTPELAKPSIEKDSFSSYGPTRTEIDAVPVAERRSLIDRIKGFFATNPGESMLVAEKADETVVTEPEVVVPPAPTAEEIAAVRARTEAVRKRLAEKGLLAA